MAYKIECRNCHKTTIAKNIVDLIESHTTDVGTFICGNCKSTNTFIYQKSPLQEPGNFWERWIKGIICVDTGIPTYSPYIFLTADNEDAKPSGMHFCYYKDTRSIGGNLKHGHGPGGPPVLDFDHIFQILEQLIVRGHISKKQIVDFVSRM